MKTTRILAAAAVVAAASVALLSCKARETGPAEAEKAAEPVTASSGTSPSRGPGRGQIMHGGAGGMMAQLRSSCPMVVQGANVKVTDTEGGVELVFTTSGGDVNDLRQRVEHMSQMYQMHGDHGSMMWHYMSSSRMGPGMGMALDAGVHGPMPAAKASVETIDNGARLVLTPVSAAELAALREHVRFHQARMQSGQCWMWSSGSTQAAPGGEK